jgi:hypothetical protein
MQGLSRRTVVGNAVCSLILFLFLWDSTGTSWFIVVTVGVGAAVDLWKVTKILGWNRALNDAELQTNQIDAVGKTIDWRYQLHAIQCL